MLGNYLKISTRHLMKRGLYSFINVFGLSVGIAACLVIWKYLEFELSYDRFHQNANTIYRTVTTGFINGERIDIGAFSGHGQGPALLSDIPEVKSYTRTHPVEGGAVVTYIQPSGKSIEFREARMLYVDSTFLDLFTFELVSGSHSALARPSSVVITESTADKYFGKGADPVGITLHVTSGWVKASYEVKAVIKDTPQNSHLAFDFLLSIHEVLKMDMYSDPVDGPWNWTNFNTYVQLHPGANARNVEAKLPSLVDKYRGKVLNTFDGKEVITLQPILDIHLTSDLDRPRGLMDAIHFFLLISLFILFIAWVNYVNLSTARAVERAREVGVKKAIGVLRTQLVGQFIFESVFLNFLSLILSVGLALFMLPVLGDILDKGFFLDFSEPRLWIVLAVLFLAGSIISGAYPALVLSSFKTTDVIKGSIGKAGAGLPLRKGLVVFQFAASLLLIAGTFAVYQQIQFMKDQEKGFNTDQMLVVRGPRVWKGEGFDERKISFKDELRKLSFVRQVATSGTVPGGWENNWGANVGKKGGDGKAGMVYFVDMDFIKTYGLQLISGREWDPELASDLNAVLINEAAIEAYGLGDAQKALNEKLEVGGVETVAILGVLKNYHWNSLKTAHTPILLWPVKVYGHLYSIQLAGGNYQEVIGQIEALFKKDFPGNPFDYYFLDDFYNQQYKADQQFGQLFTVFALTAIVIACLGLWGLAAFTTTQRSKEISIRKVLGASLGSIMSLLSAQFFKLILIAGLIALPVTWFAVDTWLENYAFRIGLSWYLFIVPVLILAVIAMGTVSVITVKAAAASPVNGLRSE